MKEMLLKSFIVINLFLITFFSINLNNVNAAYFSYDSFNWEQFLEANKNQWISSCDEGDEKCYDRIIKTQERFYKRLYKLLTKYQRKGFTIDDNVIIATVFFGLTPNSFKDPVEGEKNPFNLDSEDDASYIADISAEQAAKAYFEQETDSLKTLMNSMIGYTQKCYGVTADTPSVNADGVTVCPGQANPMEGRCVVDLKTMESSFFQKLGIFGFTGESNDAECQSLSSSYSGYFLGPISSKKEVNLELYWNFLIDGNYLDNKDHLQSYYKYILKETGHKHMNELLPEEYEEHLSEIKQCRDRIVRGIKSVLKTNEKNASKNSLMNNMPAYWWPIGSAEVRDINGKQMASDEPEVLDILNKYGTITDATTGEASIQHNGIDIPGTENSTNVIASLKGTVVGIIDDNGGKCVNGDIECGNGYGNYVILQHVDNNYTVYAHMAEGSLTIKNGDVVNQGQVIGKVGMTGDAVVSHLHFEVRVGGNDSSSVQDPLEYVDPQDPRKVSVNSDFLEFIKALEGTVEKNGKYVVHDAEDKGKYRTFSYGIVAEFNADVMRTHGLEPSTLRYGSLVEKSLGDIIFQDVLMQHVDSVKNTVANIGLSLSSNQIEALTSLEFNCGNINGFKNAYATYGNSQALCNNWWLRKASGGYGGLPKRRKAECELFVNGTYNMNPYG